MINLNNVKIRRKNKDEYEPLGSFTNNHLTTKYRANIMVENNIIRK